MSPQEWRAAAALAQDATEQYLREGGIGLPWDQLPEDRKERAIISQLRTVRIVLAAVATPTEATR